MSDAFRRDIGEQAKSTFTPEGQQSNMDKVREGADNLANKAQPQDQKSYTQQATDKAKETFDDLQKKSGGDGNQEGGSMMDKAKDALGLNK